MSGTRIILFTLLAMTTLGLNAQKSKIQRANQLYKDLNYQDAIELYLSALDKGDNSEAKINLADCYRHLDNWADAEYWYGQVVRLPAAQPIHKLYYGMALQSNGKCDQAKPYFEEYLAINPDDSRAQYLNKACDENVVEALMKAGALYQVINVAKLNTAYDDFGATYFKDGIVWSSERDRGASVKRIHSWTGHPFLELFNSKTALVDEKTLEYNYSNPEKYSAKVNSKFHDGPVSYNSDFSEMFFTRNNLTNGKIGKDDDGVIRLKVFSTKKNGDSWGEFVGLPFNSDEYSVAHPALSQDGSKLYFASDMPGGFGGMDLYISYFENGRWSPPSNLGPTINTEGHEVFPFLHPDGTLYFASDGNTGLGGLDIFYTMERGNGFTPVINVGSPINTTADDFFLVLNKDKTHGYFSSNREGGAGGDDIYSFTKFSVESEVLVFDRNTGEPIEGALVNTGGCNLGELLTGADGRARFQLGVDQTCDFLATKDTYEDNSTNVSTSGYKPGDRIFVQIPLSQPLDLKVTGIIRDQNNGKPLTGARVVLESDCGQPAQESLVGADGYYEFELRPNCCYVLKVYKDNYITKTETFCTETTPKDRIVNAPVALQPVPTKPVSPVSPEPLPPVKPEVGPVVLEHLYYDFDQAFIRGDAVASLDNLVKLLKDNGSVIVEIGSHTDSRATHKYNERLSSRRAESVVRYLIQRGISKDRLRAKGYGETVHVNNCNDNVPCSEEQHQRNRRTEFRVIGTINNNPNTTLDSKAPNAIKIDPCKKCPF
jgi:outer membrane protein OmpA-like peptidoglycan-associated protein/tetratricopeptide (TPR) repeat protein